MTIGREDFKKILKEKGLKVTRQRLVVLEVLAENEEKHLTAEEIYDKVKVENPDIGLATVYRTIQLLSELHLIDRINFDDGFVRYEIGNLHGREQKHHHHQSFLRQDPLLQKDLHAQLQSLEKSAHLTCHIRMNFFCK